MIRTTTVILLALCLPSLAANTPRQCASTADKWARRPRRVGVIYVQKQAAKKDDSPQTAAKETAAPEIVDRWRYTLRRPAEEWREAKFDDSAWGEGSGGFGTHGTPGARVGTNWSTNSIWLRKSFSLESVPAKPALLMHHDEDAEVYINGKSVAVKKGYTTEYIVVPLDEDQRKALRAGRNVMAVHCRQTRGGQFIDVHLVDADSVPKLPPPQRNTKPFASELVTEWGAAVTPDNAWTEYPRPQLQRDNWRNLNGLWDYAITPAEQTETPQKWTGKILVPFCLESKLGGVQRLLDPTEALWYRRTFEAAPVKNERTLLNFEAVDYRCTVFVNGKPIPVRPTPASAEQDAHVHQGGNTPFWLDVTEALRDGENELVVRVEDDTEGWQLHGKQTLNPRGIWYTQVSGIWQTVWLEQVADSYFTDLKITTDADAGTITVQPTAAGPHGDAEVEIVVADGDREVARARGKQKSFTLTVKDAKRWSPDSPHLYDLHVTLLDADGRPLDRVRSYAGIRSVGKVRDDAGHWRFTLNGEPIFHWGPLDQGWWPDGLLTPPSDEAMRHDIAWLKSAGFNMIRKHIKVEPRRYYLHCDRLGMMVWQDQVSGGKRPPWTRLQPDPVDAEWPPLQHKQFMLELARMIDTLENHPSIVCWVPFNEAWGQHRTLEVGKWTVRRDPTRLVNIASGGNFWPVGDVVDAHKYPHPGFPFEQGRGGRFDDYIKVMGEFGGHGYPVVGHLWDANRRNWGYGDLPKDREEYKQRYMTSLRMLNELRAKGIAAGVYTQTTDVEGEVNGLVTYDRKVVKIPAEQLARLHQVLFEEPPQTAAREDKPGGPGEKTDRANIVVYLADDHSQFDSSLYGNANIPTPQLEQLAKQGLTFTHAFVGSPSCAPSRAVLLTGLMPARNGAQANHTRPKAGTHSLVQDLQAAGYEVAAIGKVAHNNYAKDFGFDFIRPPQPIPQLRAEVSKYLASRDAAKPLCLFVGTTNPHVPWTAPSTFDPATVEFPPHHLDTPSTREHRAAYYQEIKELDAFLGELRRLSREHLGDNTLFIYTSDHGSQWPFGKWNLYDYGIRVPFVAAWPGKIKPDTKTDAMISWADILPTLIDVAGGQVPENLDGRSFAEVLDGRRDAHRDVIYTTHTGDGIKNIYPIRSVRTRQWKLIHNLHPEFAHTNHSDLDRKPMAGAYWTEWADLAKQNDLARGIVDRYYRRPEWELYRVEEDKWERHNLAADPACAEKLAELKAMLAEWMRQQGDEGLVHSEPRRLDEPQRWHPDYYQPSAAEPETPRPTPQANKPKEKAESN